MNTPAQNVIEHSPSPPHPEVDVDVGLPTGKICMHSRTFFFLYELTDLSHCFSIKAIVKVSYEPTLLFQCGTTFSVNVVKCVPTRSQGVPFPLFSFKSGSKNVNKRQGKNHLNLSKLYIWEFLHFTPHSEFRFNYMERTTSINLNLTRCRLNVDNTT